MTPTMKGLLKGLRFISHIFEEEKEEEIQIGNPTDVKHVAHIGWDGPSTDPPSWMKDFKGPNESATPSSPGHPSKNSEIQWVSEGNSQTNEPPKSSRRRSSTDKNASDSPRKKDSASKTRHSRRNHSKESSEGGSSGSSNRSARQPPESDTGTDSSQRDISKKSRRKKSKESGSSDGSSRPRSKGGDSSGTHKSPLSDPRQGTGPQSCSGLGDVEKD